MEPFPTTMAHKEMRRPRSSHLYVALSWMQLATVAVRNTFRTRTGPSLDHIDRAKPALLLGNGPSLRQDLPLIDPGSFGEIIAVNHFAKTDFFSIVRPNRYFLQDRYWFDEAGHRRREVSETLAAIASRTTWPMTLMIPSAYVELFNDKQLTANTNVAIRPFDGVGLVSTPVGDAARDNTLTLRPKLWLWRKGLGYPCLSGIVQTALFELIRSEVSTVLLLGVDMTLGLDMKLDTTGRITFSPNHFYGASPKPVRVNKYRDTTAKSYVWLSQKFVLFDELSALAKQLNVEVFNGSSISLLDSFPHCDVKSWPTPDGA